VLLLSVDAECVVRGESGGEWLVIEEKFTKVVGKKKENIVQHSEGRRKQVYYLS